MHRTFCDAATHLLRSRFARNVMRRRPGVARLTGVCVLRVFVEGRASGRSEDIAGTSLGDRLFPSVPLEILVVGRVIEFGRRMARLIPVRRCLTSRIAVILLPVVACRRTNARPLWNVAHRSSGVPGLVAIIFLPWHESGRRSTRSPAGHVADESLLRFSQRCLGFRCESSPGSPCQHLKGHARPGEAPTSDEDPTAPVRIEFAQKARGSVRLILVVS
jgi:hypothetical protein